MKIGLYSTFWRYWTPPIAWALTIMLFSGDWGGGPHTFHIFNWMISLIVTLNPKTISLYHFYFRKALHVMCYGVLSVLWLRALMASYPERAAANIILALVLCLAVAIIDEGHQCLLATRSGSLGDVALDLAGGVLFLFPLVSYWRRRIIASSEAKPPFF